MKYDLCWAIVDIGENLLLEVSETFDILYILLCSEY